MASTAARAARREDAEPDVETFADFVRSGKPGGHSYVVFLGLRLYDPAKLVAAVRRGLAYRTFERLQKNVALSQLELARVVQIPPRTLARRRKEGHLSADESD